MRAKSRVTLLALAACAIAAFTPATASAAITETSIDEPAADLSYYDYDIDGAPPLVDISGTSDGTTGDKVDIVCAYDGYPLADNSNDILADVPVEADGDFSVTIDLSNVEYYVCRLIAVPADAGEPYDQSAFAGRAA